MPKRTLDDEDQQADDTPRAERRASTTLKKITAHYVPKPNVPQPKNSWRMVQVAPNDGGAVDEDSVFATDIYVMKKNVPRLPSEIVLEVTIRP